MSAEKLVLVRSVTLYKDKQKEKEEKENEEQTESETTEPLKINYTENDKYMDQIHTYAESELLRIVAHIEKSLSEEGENKEVTDRFVNQPDLQGILFVDVIILR